MVQSYQRNDTFNLAGGGVASLTWPDRMSEGDLKDFNDWFDLMKKKINRIASQPAAVATSVEVRTDGTITCPGCGKPVYVGSQHSCSGELKGGV
jgi:hypothetical protein